MTFLGTQPGGCWSTAHMFCTESSLQTYMQVNMLTVSMEKGRGDRRNHTKRSVDEPEDARGSTGISFLLKEREG